MSEDKTVQELYESIGLSEHMHGKDVAKLTIHGNRVVGSHLVPGLKVETEEKEHGIRADIRVEKGVKIEKPVQLCFGLLPETGLQDIEMEVNMEEDSAASIVAHCTFPNAVKVLHKMNAVINIGKGASYTYFERHVHGPAGGVEVIPKAKVDLAEDARFKTEFELIKGRVGVIDIDYEVTCAARSTLDMMARVSGREDDFVKIQETGHLIGEDARAVLQTNIALRDTAQAEVYNTVTATAAGARGHVDCKEIVQNQARAKAVPIVDVSHPGAHVTHEAAIGSVDSKQLQTLLSRGLDEEEATELIIEGLLS
ncbi:MAG: SufD family Fe-S cluster assembly protein [bacterium]